MCGLRAVIDRGVRTLLIIGDSDLVLRHLGDLPRFACSTTRSCHVAARLPRPSTIIRVGSTRWRTISPTLTWIGQKPFGSHPPNTPHPICSHNNSFPSSHVINDSVVKGGGTRLLGLDYCPRNGARATSTLCRWTGLATRAHKARLPSSRSNQAAADGSLVSTTGGDPSGSASASAFESGSSSTSA